MNEARVGVYICHCGLNIASTVDVEEVTRITAGFKGVTTAKNYTYLCSEPGQALIKKDVTDLGLTRVVVCACSPRMHETTFRNALAEVGLNRYCFEMANIREHCSWVHEDKAKATEKAIALARSAVAKANLLSPLEEKEVDVTARTLVIGGGIAGMQAALDVAGAGFEVILVEREPSIGGHMAQLDKTFPTLDCSACILTPRMVEVAEHAKIRLLTYSEVENISGYVGNFVVTVRKKATSVDSDKCTGCGVCWDKCPTKVPSEFDRGLSNRKAIYVPFPQAVPNKPVIDRNNCIFFRKNGCKVCEKVCQPGAIDFSMEDEIVEENVGTIILATGYDSFDPELKPEYGYGSYSNVITGLQLERLLSASGPTGGKIEIDGQTPEDIVFIHCVGSRDTQVGNEYCSRVCCMYAAKQAYIIKEKMKDMRITMLYMDMRAFGKGFEEFYDRTRESGVIYRRGKPSEIYRKNGKLVVKAEDTILGEPVEIQTDLVVLATGLVPRTDSQVVASLLKISNSADGFFMEAHPKLRPVDTASDGVYIAGCCQGPKDIPDTVAQAKGAAASAIIPMVQGKVRIEPITSLVNEDLCSGCRICEGLCEYNALVYDDEKRVMTVREVLCKGCGSCGAACPAGAILMHHYTDEQLISQIRALVK